jgi:hypothetical protein
VTILKVQTTSKNLKAVVSISLFSLSIFLSHPHEYSTDIMSAEDFILSDVITYQKTTTWSTISTILEEELFLAGWLHAHCAQVEVFGPNCPPLRINYLSVQVLHCKCMFIFELITQIVSYLVAAFLVQIYFMLHEAKLQFLYSNFLLLFLFFESRGNFSVDGYIFFIKQCCIQFFYPNSLPINLCWKTNKQISVNPVVFR